MSLRWRSWFAPAVALLCSAANAEPVVRLPEGAERVAIGGYIRDHMQPIVDCYDRRLAAAPALKGRLIIRFDIESHGEVARSSADGMTDGPLIDCVMAEVRGWRFATPPPGVVFRISYPVLFKPE